MKKIKLNEAEKLNLDKESKKRLNDSKQSLAMRNVLESLGDAISTNTMSSKEILRVIESDIEAMNRVSNAIKGIESSLRNISNKDQIQKIEVVGQPIIKEPEQKTKVITDWEFTVKRDTFGKIIKVNAKGN